MKTMLKLTDICKSFNKNILNHLNFEVFSGEYVSIYGKSGAGKSTLMNILGLLDRDFKGTYMFQEQVVNPKDYDKMRNCHIGFVFQQYNLLPTLTAKENVLLPYNYCQEKKLKIYNRCEELFIRFGLKDQIDQPVNTLSGGEKQRTALIRSIIMDPEIILADEPTGNLDDENAKQVKNFFREMKEIGKTVIVVTHDMSFAYDTDRCMHICNGGLHELGKKYTVG